MIGLRPQIVFWRQLVRELRSRGADLGAIQIRLPLLRCPLARRLSKQVNTLVVQELYALPYRNSSGVL